MADIDYAINNLPDGYETRLTERVVSELPEGFKQKLAIARALLRKPPILIFDEPGQMLDERGDNAFLEAVKKLRGSCTILIITHRPSHMRIADRLIVLNAGRLQFNGDPEEALSQMQGGQRMNAGAPGAETTQDAVWRAGADTRQMRHLSQSAILEEVGPPRLVRVLLLLLSLSVFGFIGWAAVTELKETTKASGEVVPTGSVLAIQHLEGGIIERIFVREGDIVNACDTLVRLNPTAARAQLEETEARAASLEIRRERLLAFAEGRDPDFSAAPARFSKLVDGERAILRQQFDALDQEASVLEAQARQRRSELAVLGSQVLKLTERIRNLRTQKDMRERLAEKGLVSKLVFLQTLEQYQTAVGELAEIRGKMVSAESAIDEAGNKIAQLQSQRRNEALEETGRVAADLASVRETARRLNDRVTRLDITAPVHGIVKGLATNTVGGVIPPGGLVTEIVPIDRELIVEARISPVDIGHISIGHKATVKVTTFDFARFGSIEGTVTKISASTFKDRENEVYYKAEVRLENTYVGSDPKANRILPGMVTEIDINTGKRTVLRYLLRPVFQSLDVALSER
jgi:membrane fusion protein, adhesin transport system